MAAPIKYLVPDPTTHIFETDMGSIAVVTAVNPEYDMEHLVRDRGISLCRILQFSNLARMANPGYTPGPRAIASTFLSNPVLLED